MLPNLIIVYNDRDMQPLCPTHDPHDDMPYISLPVLDEEANRVAALAYYLHQTQFLPPARLRALQFRQLAELSDYAYNHSPYWRERLARCGLSPKEVITPEGFLRLKPMTRRDVREAGDALYCAAIPKTHLPTGITRTSGSTGEPVVIRKTQVNNLFWQALMLRHHFWNRRDVRGRMLVIRSEGEKQVRQQNSWGAPVTHFFESGPVRLLPIVLDIAEQVKEMQAFKPDVLLIYPTNLDAIVSYCQREDIRILGIKHIISHAETLSPRVRQRAEAFFGAKVEDNYSSQEAGIMALQCPQTGKYHVMAESVILEVLDEHDRPCAEGEVGRVVVTDLHNFATPLIRYAVGDYAEMGGACSCGRNLPTIRALRGRERNMFVRADGVMHWPRIDFDEWRGCAQIRQYQMVQHAVDDVEMRLVATPRLTEAQEQELRVHMYTGMGYSYPLRFTYYEDRLPLGANGKFEEFLSYVTPLR